MYKLKIEWQSVEMANDINQEHDQNRLKKFTARL